MIALENGESKVAYLCYYTFSDAVVVIVCFSCAEAAVPRVM